MGTLPDVEARDETWFAAFYRAEHGLVLAYARRRVPDADDVVAEVFATAWRLRHTLVEPVRPWLIRAALHVVMHTHRAELRRDRLRTRVASLWPGEVDEAERVAERHDARALVALALPVLAPGDREILRLAAWENLDTAELALVLDCTENAARVRLHRARRRLRVLVEHHRAGASGATAIAPTAETPRTAP